MAAYQYVYVMKGLTKIYPGGKKVLDNVWLSFLPGAKIEQFTRGGVVTLVPFTGKIANN